MDQVLELVRRLRVYHDEARLLHDGPVQKGRHGHAGHDQRHHGVGDRRGPRRPEPHTDEAQEHERPERRSRHHGDSHPDVVRPDHKIAPDLVGHAHQQGEPHDQPPHLLQAQVGEGQQGVITHGVDVGQAVPHGQEGHGKDDRGHEDLDLVRGRVAVGAEHGHGSLLGLVFANKSVVSSHLFKTN